EPADGRLQVPGVVLEHAEDQDAAHAALGDLQLGDRHHAPPGTRGGTPRRPVPRASLSARGVYYSGGPDATPQGNTCAWLTGPYSRGNGGRTARREVGRGAPAGHGRPRGPRPRVEGVGPPQELLLGHRGGRRRGRPPALGEESGQGGAAREAPRPVPQGHVD